MWSKLTFDSELIKRLSVSAAIASLLFFVVFHVAMTDDHRRVATENEQCTPIYNTYIKRMRAF